MSLRASLSFAMIAAFASLSLASGAKQGDKAAADEAAGNYLALAQPPKDDASLGARVEGLGLSVQAPKGAFDDVGQPGDETSIFASKSEPTWRIAITRDKDRTHSTQVLQGMITTNVKDGKITAPATQVTVGPGVKAAKIEYTREVAGKEQFAILHAFPVKKEGTKGMDYQVVFLGEPKDRDALAPIFAKCIETLASSE